MEKTKFKLDREKEKALIIEAQKGNKEAIWDLMQMHEKFIHYFVNRYYNHYNGQFSQEDMLQIAYEYFLIGIYRFDFEKRKGSKFTSYISEWIEKGLKELRLKQRSLRINQGMHAMFLKYQKYTDLFYEKNGRYPTVKEIGKELGIQEESVLGFLNYDKKEVSIYSPLGDDDTELIDFITYEEYEDSEKDIMLKRIIIRNLLSFLDEKERKIIELNSGYNMEKRLTLEEIGEIYGVSRERARQIYHRGLDKLKKLKDMVLEYGMIDEKGVFVSEPLTFYQLYFDYDKETIDEAYNDLMKPQKKKLAIIYKRLNTPFDIFTLPDDLKPEYSRLLFQSIPAKIEAIKVNTKESVRR